MQRRLQAIEAIGIPTEFHAYEGLGHGFGFGTETVAEGWIDMRLLSGIPTSWKSRTSMARNLTVNYSNATNSGCVGQVSLFRVE